MRLFIATPLSNTTQAEVLQYQPPTAEGARLLRPELLHMTLQFIGEAEPKVVSQALQNIQFNAFSTHFTQTGVFSPKKSKNILWLGLALNDDLARLQKMISHSLREAGIKIDSRQFTPHITLARCKRSMDKAYIDAFVNQEPIAWPYQINQFHLYRSHNKGGQLHYDIIESY